MNRGLLPLSRCYAFAWYPLFFLGSTLFRAYFGSRTAYHPQCRWGLPRAKFRALPGYMELAGRFS